jgi:hypothetical protein
MSASLQNEVALIEQYKSNIETLGNRRTPAAWLSPIEMAAGNEHY